MSEMAYFPVALDPNEKFSENDPLDRIGDDLLNCSICFEKYKKPKILPCLHTFCQRCIERHFEIYKLKNGGRLSCPTCRELIPVRAEGISGLRNDLTVNRTAALLEDINALLQQQEAEDGKMDYAGAAYPSHDQDLEEQRQEVHLTMTNIQNALHGLRAKMLKLYMVENIIVFTMEKECDKVNNRKQKIGLMKKTRTPPSSKDRAELTKQITEEHAGSLGELAIEQDRLYSSLMELKSTHDILEEALERTTPYQFKLIYPKLHRMCVEVCPMLNKGDSPIHLSNSMDVDALAAQWLPEEKTPTGDLSNKKKRGNNKKIGAKFLYKIGCRGACDGQFDFPTHASFLPDGGFIVSDKNNYRLQIFDAKGKFKRTWLTNKVKPRRVRYNAKENAFYIVDEIMECVKVYSPSGVLLRCIGEKYFECPAGLDFDSHGNLIMTDADRCFVSVHSPDGETVNKWYYRDFGDYQIPTPYYAIANEDDQILVSDFRNNNVKMFSQCGKLLLCIDKLVCPRGLCVDPYGNILIAEGDKHRVSMYSPHGKFLQDLLTEEDGLHHPLALDVNVEGQVLVTQCGYCSPHEVLVYQMYLQYSMSNDIQI